jgi:hypothetical protein
MDPTTIDKNSVQDDESPTLLTGSPQLRTTDASSNTYDGNSTPPPAIEGNASSGAANSPPSFQHLPNEVLEHILDYLVHDSAKLLPIDQRASLSTESFVSAPPRYLDEDQNNLGKFVWSYSFSPRLDLLNANSNIASEASAKSPPFWAVVDSLPE